MKTSSVQAAVCCWCISWSFSSAQGGSLILRLRSSSTTAERRLLHMTELHGAMGMLTLQRAVSGCSVLFGALCVSLSLTEGCCSPLPPPFFFITGFFKVLGQLTETGVASPEQFISKYIIISWHFHRGCWEPEDTDADSKSTWLWGSQLPDARGI